MKRLTAFFILLSCITNYLFSQDLIVLKNGDEIKSKVLEITPAEIKYKKFDNLDGPTVTILKTDVFMIKYQNGTKEVINNTNTSSLGNENNTAKKFIDLKPNRVGFYINPLGFIQFGPMIGTEITSNSRLIIDGHLRFSSLGALMYVVNADNSDGNPYKISGLGVGGGLKYFMPSRIGGFYFGGIFEYGWQTNYYAEDKPWIWQNEIKYIVAMASIGYKFRFNSGFYINTGALLGAESTFKSQWYYTKNYNNDSSIHIDDTSIGADGMLEVSFGFEF